MAYNREALHRSNPERQSTAQMLGFICREIGVLLLVFEVLHVLWVPKESDMTHGLWLNLLLSGAFIATGIMVERHRR